MLGMTTWLTGHVMVGTVVSAELIWNEHAVETRPVASVALHVTIVMPIGNWEPDAGEQRYGPFCNPHVPYPDGE